MSAQTEALREAAAHLRREYADSDGDAWAPVPRACLPFIADLLDDEQSWVVDHVHSYPDHSHMVRLAKAVLGGAQ